MPLSHDRHGIGNSDTPRMENHVVKFSGIAYLNVRKVDFMVWQTTIAESQVDLWNRIDGCKLDGFRDTQGLRFSRPTLFILK